MTVAFISHSDCGRHDTGWGHPEHVGRLRAIPRALREEPELFQRLQHVEARHATDDELALAHDRQYIERIRATGCRLLPSPRQAAIDIVELTGQRSEILPLCLFTRR